MIRIFWNVNANWYYASHGLGNRNEYLNIEILGVNNMNVVKDDITIEETLQQAKTEFTR